MIENEILHKKESYKIQGAIFDVYKEIGCGFLESVYQECLEMEFRLRQIPYASQSELILEYKGVALAQKYKPDFVCYNKIIIEIKAVREITSEHRAQIINYLKASNMELGILVNFGAYPRVEIQRFINKFASEYE